MRANKIVILVLMLFLGVYLSSCSKSAENEHLPEYCRTYSKFMETASPDLYELVDGINRFDYLDAISVIELEFEVDEPGREINLDGLQCFQNLTSLSLTGKSFKDISQISALRNIQEIRLIDTSVVSIDSFKNLSKVKYLTITDTKTLQSVAGIGDMTKITNLELVGNGIVDIDELSKLSNLVSLDLSDNEIVHFPNIGGLGSLETLDLSGNNIVDFGEDLSGLSTVTYLDLSHNNITDLGNFDDLGNLTYLDLSFNNLGDITGSPDFSGLLAADGLIELYLNDNGITSISGLQTASLPSIEKLYLHNNEIENIEYISSYNTLTELTLNNNKLSNIDNLSGMVQLTSIDLSNNEITSFGGLTNISGLVSINLHNNDITIIPDLSEDLPNLQLLDISYNNLTNTSGVMNHESLRSINLSNNGLFKLQGISNIPFLEELILVDYEPVSCLNGVEVTDETCIPSLSFDPNTITWIEDSFDTLPSFTDLVLPSGRFNFSLIELGSGVEIYNSFKDIEGLFLVDFTDKSISYIDPQSISSPQIQYIFMNNNNISDIQFILDNPNLIQVSINNNPINTLGVFNGDVHEDLHNLQAIYATNIITGNDLDSSFIGLPNLSIIDLTASNINAISNSFNNLGKLTNLQISASGVTRIEDSFNNLFTDTSVVGTVLNSLSFVDSQIAYIDNSFNNAVYTGLDFSSQTPGVSDTYIYQSFNNTSIDNEGNILFVDSNYKRIEDSFNNSVFNAVRIRNSEVGEIINSFDQSVFSADLDLSENNLTTMENLSSSSIVELYLNDNELTTVAFIDGIEELTVIDISRQEDELGPTLNGIDGINNLSMLNTLLLEELEITYIDGLKNVGLSEFTYTSEDHNNVLITSISSDSFLQSELVSLDLQGHVLNDFDFLSNMDNLTDLVIFSGIDNLMYFENAVFKDNLVNLYIGNTLEIADFSPINGYDNLETFVFGSLVQTSIRNLDNLASVTNIAFLNRETILLIENSFNNMSSMNVDADLLSLYSNLAIVTSSFDMMANDLELNGNIQVIDSFNNVTSVTVLSQGEPISLIDSDSFDSVLNFELHDTQYESYAYLSDYPLLETVLITNPSTTSITGINNPNINFFSVNTLGSSVQTASINIHPEGTVTFTNSGGDLLLVSNASNVTIDNASHFELTTSANNLHITGSSESLVVNGTSVETMVMDYLTVLNDIVLNTEVLSSLTAQPAAMPNAASIAIFSDIITQHITIDTGLVTITNPSLTNLTINTGGNVDISSLVSDFSLEGYGDDFTIINPNMVSLTHNLAASSLVYDSLLVSTIDFLDSMIGTTSYTTGLTELTIQGNSNQVVTIEGQNIATVTIDAPNAEVLFTTESSGLIDVMAIATYVTVYASNITGVNLIDSSIGNITIDASLLTNVTSNNSTIDDYNISSLESTVNINKTNSPFSNYTLEMANLSSLDFNLPDSNVSIYTDVAQLNLNGAYQNINLFGDSLVNLNVADGTTINQLNSLDCPSLSNVTLGTSSIQSLTIDSDSNTLIIDGNNVVTATISGDTYIGIDISLPSAIVNLNSSKSFSMNIDVVAESLSIDSDLQSILLGTSTNINTLLITGNDLNSVFTGLGQVANSIIELNYSSGAGNQFNMSGTNVDSIVITSDDIIDEIYIEQDTQTIVDIDLTSTTDVEITVNTAMLDIVSGGNVDITSSQLDELIAVAPSITLDLSKTNLDLTLDVTTPTLYISGENIIGVQMVNGSTIGFMSIDNTSIVNYDFTQYVDRIQITDANITDLVFYGNESANLETPLIETVTSISFIDEMSIVSSNNILVVTMEGTLLQVNSPNLQSIDLTNTNADSIEIQSSSLATLDLSETAYLSAYINSSSASIEATLVGLDHEIVGSNLVNLTVHSITDNLLDITTSSSNITLNTPGNIVLLNAENLSSLTGVAFTTEITNQNILKGTTLVSLTSDVFTVSNTAVIDVLEINSTSVITDLFVQTNSINQLLTNNAIISKITIDTSSTIVLDLQTKVNDITITNGNEITIDTLGNNALTLSGNIIDLSITGNGLNTLNLADLSNSEIIALYGSNYTDLSFLTEALYTTLSTLHIDTLSVLQIEHIISSLKDTNITLYSSITDQNIYDYFYNQQQTQLHETEGITNELHELYREDVLDDAVALFNGNQYLTHLDDVSVRSDVDNGTVKTAEEYFLDYLTTQTTYIDEAQMRAALGNIAVDAIYDEITATITNPTIANVDAIVFGYVNSEINRVADINATNMTNNKGWSIG